MLDKDKIVELMEEADLTDVEVLKEEEGMLVIRFFYDFDEDEINAAEAFSGEELEETAAQIEEMEEEEDIVIPEAAVEESEKVEDEEEFDEEEYLSDEEDEDEEYYGSPKLKYLSDIAIDHVGEVLEEIRDEEDIEVQYIGYDMEEEATDYYEFVGLFYEKGEELDIDEILEDMDI